MLNKKIHVVIAMTMFSASAFAATQGTLGATSTATYVNAFGVATAPQVQVLNVKDATVLPTTGNVIENGTPRKGIEDQFCVVNTEGGAVLLTFSGAEGASDHWQARAVDDTVYEYYLNVGPAGGSAQRISSALGNTLVVPAGQTVRNESNCALGNVKKIAAEGEAPPPVGKIFASTITIVATPQ